MISFCHDYDILLFKCGNYETAPRDPRDGKIDRAISPETYTARWKRAACARASFVARSTAGIFCTLWGGGEERRYSRTGFQMSNAGRNAEYIGNRAPAFLLKST